MIDFQCGGKDCEEVTIKSPEDFALKIAQWPSNAHSVEVVLKRP